MHLSKPTEGTTPRVNPKVNHEALSDYDGSIYVHPWLKKKKVSFDDILIMGKAMHTWGQKVYEESLNLPFNFIVNL